MTSCLSGSSWNNSDGLVFGIWSNTYAYAQQASSSTLSPAGSSRTITISPEIKAKMCAPDSPGLKVVNTTEARICGITKTVKSNTTTVAASPSTSTTAISSPSTSSSTKPTITAAAAAPSLKKQQQVSTTNAVSSSTGYVTWATVGSLRKISETSLSSSASPLSIAPQVKAIKQQQAAPPPPQPQPPITPIKTTTAANDTAGQNYTFAAATGASPMATSDQMLYLGYHGNSNSKYNDNHDSNTRSVSDSTLKPKHTKPHAIPRVKIIPPDTGMKKKTITASLGGAGDDTMQSFQQSTGSISDSSSLAGNTISPTNDYDTSEDKSSHSSSIYNGFTSKKKMTNEDRSSHTDSDVNKQLVHNTKKSNGISDSTIKKKTSIAKLDTHSTNEGKSSGYTDDGANIQNNSGGHSIFGFSDG